MISPRGGDWAKMFDRRGAILGAAQAALVATLVGRMYYLQVVQADRYHTLAENNRIKLNLIPPTRGRIVDRFGEPLAINKQQFRALVMPEQVDKLDDTLNALALFVEISEHDRERIKKKAGRKNSFLPIAVKKNLTWKEMTHIQVNAPDLPGVLIDEVQIRFYPHGEVAAHFLGYVAAVDESDLTGDPLLQLPGFQVGKDGIEKVYDTALRGTGGTSQVEVNAYGRVIREVERKEGNSGADVVLTIDERLQRFSAARLDAESAAVVLMDIYNGDVLAMVSNPSFDANVFSRGLTNEEWEALSTNDLNPLINKSIAGQFSPGSTFKTVVTLAALEDGVIAPDQTVHCNGRYSLGRYVKHCHKVHGSVDMVRALSVSCDVYFYEIARRLGVDKIAAMARRLGLGERSGIGLPGEQRGLIPTEAWKMAARGEPWVPGDNLNVGIGQGDVLVTPIQLATLTARISNGGFVVRPRLVRPSSQLAENDARVVGDTDQALESLGIDIQHLNVLKQGMYDAVNGPSGTTTAAANGRLRLKGPEMKDWTLSGKTGTTQVYRISTAEREAGDRQPEDTPRHLREHALFVAYAPSHQPRYAIAVVVEHALGGGGTAAAPVARDIMEETLRLDPSRRPRVDGSQIASATEPSQ